MALWAPSHERSSGAARSQMRRFSLRLPAKKPGRPCARRTVPRRMHGPSRWKATADPRSRRQPSDSASTAVWAVECNRCKTRASLPLDAIRRPRDTPIWKLEAALKCRSCRKGRWAPPVHMIKLAETREITPYKCIRTRRGDPSKADVIFVTKLAIQFRVVGQFDCDRPASRRRLWRLSSATITSTTFMRRAVWRFHRSCCALGS
jgi:hypothetical protein